MPTLPPRQTPFCQSPLDLHLGQSVFPDGDERSDAIFAVVEQDHPCAS